MDIRGVRSAAAVAAETRPLLLMYWKHSSAVLRLMALHFLWLIYQKMLENVSL